MKQIILCLLLFATATAAAGERNITLERDFGTLHGTLLTPDTGTQTVALIIAGSGPTDRNGNNPMGAQTNSYLYLAQALEKAGIASLRYDKRAIGASKLESPDKAAELTFDDYIGDAVALAELLAAEGFTKVVLIGHSEGSLIALCAAQQSKAATAVISVAGTGYPLDEVIQAQLAAQLVPAHMELMMEATSLLAQLKQGHRVEKFPRELAGLFHPNIQTFLISELRYDPRQEIRKLNIPVLIVNGDNDLQVSVDNAKALHKAQPAAQLAIIADMTHPLKKSTARTLIEQSSSVYANSTLAIDPDLTQVITAFIGTL